MIFAVYALGGTVRRSSDVDQGLATELLAAGLAERIGAYLRLTAKALGL